MTRAQPPGRRLVDVGDVLHLRDEDYRYGSGHLVLRVLVVHDVRRLPDGLWIFLRGMEIGRDGRDVEQRDVLVRVGALAGARRTVGTDGDSNGR